MSTKNNNHCPEKQTGYHKSYFPLKKNMAVCPYILMRNMETYLMYLPFTTYLMGLPFTTYLMGLPFTTYLMDLPFTTYLMDLPFTTSDGFTFYNSLKLSLGSTMHHF